MSIIAEEIVTINEKTEMRVRRYAHKDGDFIQHQLCTQVDRDHRGLKNQISTYNGVRVDAGAEKIAEMRENAIAFHLHTVGNGNWRSYDFEY